MMVPTAVEVHNTRREDGSAVIVFTVGGKERKFHLSSDLADAVREGLEFEDD